MFAGLAHGASRAGRRGHGAAPPLARGWPVQSRLAGPGGVTGTVGRPIKLQVASSGRPPPGQWPACQRAAGPAPRPGPSLAGGTPSRPWPGDGQEAPRGEARQSRPSGGAAIRNRGLRWRSFGAGTGTAEVDPGKSQPLTVTKDSESPGHLRRPTLPRSLVLIGIQVCRRWVRPKSCSY